MHHKGTLRIKNNVKNVYAVVKSTDVFSAHPDSKGLIEYVESTAQESNLKRVFLVHGDEESLRDFKSTLDNLDICNITIPERGQSFEL
jgi:metallo-beta-lactamase family protein